MKQCPKCGNEHDKPGTFCSRTCANSRTFSDETNARRAVTNRKRTVEYWKDKLKYIICKGCHTSFRFKKGRVYCCTECRLLNKLPKIKYNSSTDRVPKEDPINYTKRIIESREVVELTESVIRKHMKRYLVDLHGHKCMICDISEWMGKPVPLVCDHIDGDSTNSTINNFRNVCCNCDAQLDTYKSKNRGRGRSYDRNLYRKQMEGEADRRAVTALKADGP